ncbi:hypothetical protein [Paenibacillus sp. 1011MAR3C5]|uniref:hypothetical protein n=1 Tax=Paenibacillus sp. 1011MAR3C5 TaxID=1675787 RepID=UPI001601F29E|nr:hypothetical protein [Paenibacillus sp. 1011MAR3C5]
MINNNTVITGYALLAAREMGFSKAELEQLEVIMRSVLDEYTEDEAADFYRQN